MLYKSGDASISHFSNINIIPVSVSNERGSQNGGEFLPGKKKQPKRKETKKDYN